ncbi:5023_t:CDS:2 [Funneliformis geosporum]|uniref:5023_t:CDS:1 n=1 Tax=Funneliformis geosporum TaxID=1117311 RepID=A0A9W4T3N4_9GLOM|nr:5023_t:CDS:2 [Funneliformis geosporum]
METKELKRDMTLSLLEDSYVRDFHEGGNGIILKEVVKEVGMMKGTAGINL